MIAPQNVLFAWAMRPGEKACESTGRRGSREGAGRLVSARVTGHADAEANCVR
jgi:hypothetical protein